MNELEELKEYIPEWKENYQYKLLAQRIGYAIDHGKSSISMDFDKPISDEAIEKLYAAGVSVLSNDESNNYDFTF